MTELPVTLGWLEDTFLPTKTKDRSYLIIDWWFGDALNLCYWSESGQFSLYDGEGNPTAKADITRKLLLDTLKDYLKPNASIHPSPSPMSSLFWSGVYDCSQHYYQGITCIEACDRANGTT